MNEVKPGDILTRLQKENERLKEELAAQIKIDRVNADRELELLKCIGIVKNCLLSSSRLLNEDFYENWETVLELNRLVIRNINYVLYRK